MTVEVSLLTVITLKFTPLFPIKKLFSKLAVEYSKWSHYFMSVSVAEFKVFLISMWLLHNV